MNKKFEKEGMDENNPKWENAIKRNEKLYTRKNDLRSEFERDYTRILYSNGYRRLKNKTQVFFSPSNDHVCTRIEHTISVGAIGYTIGKYLGLNLELIKAISIGHDIGHSPFGHPGERVLNKLSKKEIGIPFWHEKNSLYFVDKIETLEDSDGNKRNLDLTYAVRDGIISHCGEINENCIKPRKEAIDLSKYTQPNQFQPYTWEACVVKIADKISYLSRDIEDTVDLKILSKEDIKELNEVIEKKFGKTINNTNIINELITDLCHNSNIEDGLQFSKEKLDLVNEIKDFNYRNIYFNDRLTKANQYFEMIIYEIYNELLKGYKGKETLDVLEEKSKESQMFMDFLEWINSYCNIKERNEKMLKNEIIYNIEDVRDYKKAVIDYISGMTDNYAIKIFQNIICF